MNSDQSELARLRSEVERLRRDLAASGDRYRRLRSRRSVRMALGLARLAGPSMRIWRKSSPDSSTEAPSEVSRRRKRVHGRRLTQRAQRKLARELVRRRAGPYTTSGAMVSMIVLTHNGADHLERLLEALEATIYRPFEVIVVDNASTDATPNVLEADRSFPVHLLQNERNVSFSVGNNQAVAMAQGELLLFLNNDVEPINAGWLGAMVQALESDEKIVSCGALLIYPVRGDAVSDLTVQHRGIHFSFRNGAVRAFNTTASDPLDTEMVEVVEVPAITGAALLVRAADFRAVGGFDERYVYGREDVDLCLRLRDRGRLVVVGGAALFHFESATHAQVLADVREANRAKNRQLFAEIWGPRLTRSVLRDRLTAAGTWAPRRQRTVGITLTQNDVQAGWGDYYTAHELGGAFEFDGWRVVYAERFEDRWYQVDGEVDMVVSLLDSYDVRRAPEGAFTVAWVRNWVDRWLSRPWFENHFLVVASSGKAAGLLTRESRFHPLVIPMATNPERFHPGPTNPLFESDYVFTGNNWGPGRALLNVLDVDPQERFMMFGRGWDKDPRVARYWRGHLNYELLPDVYRSTKIVLDDTAEPTLPYALVNGRVFDALASGALVLTDNAEGSKELFDGALPAYAGGR